MILVKKNMQEHSRS